MPDVNDRPQCPPECIGEALGTCRVDRPGVKGHESLFPARSLTELRAIRWLRSEFWALVRWLREVGDEVAFTMDASWRLLRPEFGNA